MSRSVTPWTIEKNESYETFFSCFFFSHAVFAVWHWWLEANSYNQQTRVYQKIYREKYRESLKRKIQLVFWLIMITNFCILVCGLGLWCGLGVSGYICLQIRLIYETENAQRPILEMGLFADYIAFRRFIHILLRHHIRSHLSQCYMENNNNNDNTLWWALILISNFGHACNSMSSKLLLLFSNWI